MADKSNISFFAVVLSMLVLFQSVLTVAAPCAGGSEMFEPGLEESAHAGHAMVSPGDAATSAMSSAMDCCEEGAYCSRYGCLSLSAVADSKSHDLNHSTYSYLPDLPQVDPGPIPQASFRPPALS